MTERAQQPYVLGHSETELRRLALQSAFFGELTEEVFRRAGIGPACTSSTSAPVQATLHFSRQGWLGRREACSASIAPKTR